MLIFMASKLQDQSFGMENRRQHMMFLFYKFKKMLLPLSKIIAINMYLGELKSRQKEFEYSW